MIADRHSFILHVAQAMVLKGTPTFLLVFIHEYMNTFPNTTNATTPPPVNSRSLSPNTTTFIVKGRKNALREAYNKSLSVKHSYYCVTGEELVKSYKPFVPLLQAHIDNLGVAHS